MSFRSAIVAALLASANAHITMKKPVPYSVDKLDNSPLTKAQFPCKSQNGFTVSTMNQMKVGDKVQVQLDGSAVHGGGSCQLSVTLDTEPTANSKFKVIKSIEGGCPGVSGAAGSYDVEIPASIPNGKATFAWTWFSKLSGQPELYMNCAPIEVSGGASDDSEFNSLPDMFVANLDDTCTSPQNFATKFPNPGTVVEDGGTNDLKDPTGSGCGATGSTPPTNSTGPSEPSEPSAAPSSPATEPSSPAAEPAPSNTGGVFAPGAGGSSPTTLATVPAGTGSPSSPTGSPSTGGGSSCSENGSIVCNGSDQFGICNDGQVTWQAVAPGTTCSNGSIQKRGYNGRIARPRAVVPGKAFTPSN